MTTPELKIYTPAGGTRLTAVVEKGSTRDFMLMQNDEVRLRFVLAEAVTLRAGDWISVDGAGIFECTDDKQRPSFDTATGGYRYDITMQARYRKFGNRLHRFFTEATAPETKWTLTDTIEAHAQRLVKSMNALAASYPSYRPGGEQTEWHVAVDNTVDKEKCVTITYDGIDILSGIDMVAREYECEWWFDRGTLNFGICRFGTAIAMETGKELASLTRSDSSESDATRIYFQGSTRNIPSTYRHTALFHANEKSTENGTFTFRDTVRDLPNEAIHEDVRSYAFREDAKQDLIIKGKIMPGSTFEADEKGEAVEMLSTGLIGQNDLQLVTKWNPDNGGIDAGIYRLDLSPVVITLSNIVNGGNTVNGDPRFAYRVKIHGYRIHDSHTSDNLLYQYVFDGSWKTLDNRDSQGNIVLTGGVHEFHVPEYVDNGHFGRGRTADLYITIGLIADTRECAVTLRCNVNTNIDTDTKNLVNCLTPYDPYHFASELSLQFRNTKGEPIGDVVSGVTFNPDRSDIKAERKFRMPASSLPDTSSLQPGEDLCFTFEGGVDIPFIPAAYWTSDTVMRYGSEATVNGLAERRLLLPLKDEEGNPLNGYLDTRPITAEDEVREIVKTIEECYPGTETTVTAVEQTETTYTDTYEMSDGSQDKVQWKAWRFKCAMFTDENPFNPKYRLDSEKLQVTFRDIVGSDGVRHSGGALNGMTFELLYNQSANMFEIVRDSTSLLPNDAICPKAGDGMVLTGFDVRMLSDEDCDIISQAEFGLLAKARECIAEVNTDASTYEGTVMCDIAYEQYPDFESMMLTPGHRVALTDPAFGLDNFVTRVLGFSIPLDIPYDNPRYTFGEKTAYSRLGNIEDRLNGIERPTRARSGGSAAGTGLDYNRDCYISLGTSRVQVPAVIQRSDEDSGTVTVTPAEGFLPVEVSAWMVVNGSRMTNAEWRVDCDGCTATVTAPQRRPLAVGQVPPAKIKISEVTKDMAAITITATCDGMTAVETLYVDLVTESEGHLHSMLISAPVVRVSRKQDGSILSSPTKVRISTNVFDGDKLQPSQDGFLLYRTDIDTDTAWSVMTREDGVAEIAVSDFLTANDTAEAKVRRIDLRYCCPTTENIVGEGCVTITEDGGILPTFDPETGRLNFTDLDGEKLLESDIEIKDGEPGKDGKDGEDAIILDLSNEMDSVPCDADGDVLPNVAMPSTSFAVYVGTREDTGWTFAKTDSGCTSIISGSDLVLTSITADRATVTLTATKDGKARVAVFTVTKVKAGQQGGKGDAAVIYRLHPSADKAGVAADNTVDPASVYVIVAKTVGNEQRETPVSYGTVMYRIDNGTETTLAWADTGRTQSVAIPATARALTFLLYDTDGATLLDSERIPVIRDGEDGSSVTIVSTSVHYATSTSGTVAPTSGWSVNMPALQLGKYLWTRRIVAYSDGTSTTDYSASHLGRNFEYGDFTAAQLDTLQQGVKTKIDNADFRADLKTRLKTDSDFLAATKGDKGDTGAQGEKGLKGDTGPKGDKGDKPNVTLGSDGYLTIDGIKQAKCLVGPQGIQGLQGLQGIQGPRGEIGQTGPKGDTGKTGATGATGPTGPTGPQGENGYSTIINADGTITQTKNPTTAQLTQTKTKLEAIRDTANNAASKADTAATNADSALTAANTAKTTANTALTTAQGKASMSDVSTYVGNQGFSKFSGKYSDLSGRPTIPTSLSQLTNDSGFQTASQVDSIISGKGFQTASQVNSAILGKGYATADEALDAVSDSYFKGTFNGRNVKVYSLEFKEGKLYYCCTVEGASTGKPLSWCSWLSYADVNHTHDDMATKTWVNQNFMAVGDTADNSSALGGVAAADYAKKTDIPSLSGYATQSYVDNAIHEYDDRLQIHTYATKSDLNDYVLTEDLLNDVLPNRLANYVTLNGAQTITGVKTFSNGIISDLDNDFISHGNEFNYVPSGYSGQIHINYRTRGGANGAIDAYLFRKGNTVGWASVIAASFIRNGGTSSQFLKADGSVDGNSYLTTGTASSTYAKKTDIPSLSGYATQTWVNSQGFIKNGVAESHLASIYFHQTDEINRFGGALYLQHRGGGLSGYGSTGNVYICANGGNVGIGTTNPSYKVHVKGEFYVEGGQVRAGVAKVGGDNTYGAWLQYGSNYINVKANGPWWNNTSAIWHSGMTSLSFGNYTIRRDSGHINIGTASGGGADGISVEQSGDVVVHGWLTTDGFTNNSDIRLKTLREDLTLDIRDIANAPSKVFVWKRNGRLDAGSVAQYWMGLNPLLAHEGRNGMLGMDYGKNALISVVAVAKKVVSHEERIEALERENAELRERVRVLENV